MCAYTCIYVIYTTYLYDVSIFCLSPILTLTICLPYTLREQLPPEKVVHSLAEKICKSKEQVDLR